jgi:hypothetical protein
MTSQAIHNPLADHLLTSENERLRVIDYQPKQVQPGSFMDGALLERKVVSVA